MTNDELQERLDRFSKAITNVEQALSWLKTELDITQAILKQEAQMVLFEEATDDPSSS